MKAPALQLARDLRAEGIDSRIDQFLPRPPADWQEWMFTEIRDADVVIVLGSATYKERAENPTTDGTGTGTAWESQIVSGVLYRSQSQRGRRFIPVVLKGDREEQIPYYLSATTIYDLSDPADLDSLVLQIHDEPSIDVPEVNPAPRYRERRLKAKNLRPRPPRPRLTTSRMWEGHLETWILDANGTIRHRWTDTFDGPWSDWTDFPTPPNTTNTTITAIANVGSRLATTGRAGRQDIFALATNGQTFHAHWTNKTSWTDWQPFATPVDQATAITASAMSEGHLETWILDANGTIRHRWTDTFDGPWSDWTDFPTPPNTTITAIANVGSRLATTGRAGRQDIFALATNGQTFHAHWTNKTSWTDWQPFATPVDQATAITASAMWEGHLEVWILDANGTIRHRWTDTFDGPWSDWTDFPTPPNTTITAIAYAGGRRAQPTERGTQDIFGATIDGQILRSHWTARANWSDWRTA